MVRLSFVFLLFELLFLGIQKQINSKEVTLTSINQSQYALQVEFQGQSLILQAHLSDERDWVKGDDCEVCLKDGSNEDDNKQNKKKCKDSCFSEDQHGVKCYKSQCSNFKPSHGQSRPYYVKEGKDVILNLKQAKTSNQIKWKTILVQRIAKQMKEIGRVNVFNGNKGLFGEQLVMVKDHGKDIIVHYFEESIQEQEQPGQVTRKGEKQDRIEQLLKNIEIMRQKSVKALVLSSSETSIDDQTHEQDDDGEQQEQQQINVFEISQVRLRDLFLDNAQNNNNKQSDHKLATQIPFTKTTAEFSIKTAKLLLPPIAFKKLQKIIIDKYFPKSCQFESGTLECQDKSELSLQKLDNVTIALMINGVQVQFPIRALIQSCKQKSCSFLFGVSHSKKTVFIGDFIMNIFALYFDRASNSFSLYRIDNQWSKNYKQFLKLSKHSNFIWILIVLVFTGLWWLFKICFVLACISLILNCAFHWKDVVLWFGEILSKIGDKESREELRNQKMENIKSFQKGFRKNLNKMKTRVKDRIQNALHKNQNIYDQMEQNQHIVLDREEFQHHDSHHLQNKLFLSQHPNLQQVPNVSEESPKKINKLVQAIQNKKNELIAKAFGKTNYHQLPLQNESINLTDNEIIEFQQETLASSESKQNGNKLNEKSNVDEEMFYEFHENQKQFD